MEIQTSDASTRNLFFYISLILNLNKGNNLLSKDMVKFGYTILYVADVAASVDFYEKAFGFQRKFVTPENDYAELLSGETTLAFASKTLASSNLKKGFIASDKTQQPFAIEIGFVTENPAAVLAHAVEQGATIEEDVLTKPWGQTVAYLRDIDGFLIELCSPMG